MKNSSKLLIFACTFLALTASAYAQSPREQLKQIVEQLQKTPSDNALRERVIKLAAEIKPAPAISEDANRFFVRGNTFQKEAKSVSDYDLAIAAYQEALKFAPWWADAYFNLALAFESARKFDDAIASFKLYLASIQAESAEAREAQDRIYAIEAKADMASQQARVERSNRFSGNWSQSQYTVSFDIKGSSCSIVKSASRVEGTTRIVEWCKITNDKLQLRVSGYVDGRSTAWAECEFNSEADGNHLVGKVLAGWTSADTTRFVKDYLCQGLWRQK